MENKYLFNPESLQRGSEIPGLFFDEEKNLFLLDGAVFAVEKIFSPWVVQQTSEIRLKDIGRFPLKPEDEKWLKACWVKSAGNTEFRIPKLLELSHIPLFFSSDKTEAVIPKAGRKVCHYFYDIWEPGPEEPGGRLEEELRKTLFGFSVIQSFI